jgi:hypothetical protein
MLARLMMRVCIYGLPVAAVLTWCQAIMAQDPSKSLPAAEGAAPRAGAAQNGILRTYDVSDLIINIEDRPFVHSLHGTSATGGGGFGGGGVGGGGFFSVPDRVDGARHTQDGALGRFDAQAGRTAGVATRFRLAQFGGGGRGAAGAMGTAGAMEAGETGPSSRITMPDLVRVITNTVAPESWAVNGGGEWQIEPLGTSLIVWQTEDVHARIGELLRQLGKVAAEHRTVTIDARWLMLTSDELEGLLVADPKGVPQVDREQLARLTRQPGSIRGVTSCLSSQLVYVVSGTMKNIVSSWIPVVGSIESPDRDVQLAGGVGGARIQLVSETGPAIGRGKSVGYQPIVQTINIGALLEIRPTLMPANSEAPAIVDLKSTVTIEGVGAETKAAADELAPAVDRVAIETLEFATTLRMPLKKPVLVGGLTYIPSASVAGKGKGAEDIDVDRTPAERPQMYLVLEVR